MGEFHTYWIEEIYHAARRMSRLNQGLLLLAKIENQQFTEQEELDLSGLALNKLKDFEDILQHKDIRVSLQSTGNFRKVMSPALADILLTNLINNAIRHNYTGGELRLESGTDYVQVSNTGNPLKSDPERLFERFKKESARAESLGLGLAIVKEICDNYELRISYQYQEPIHSIRVAG